MAICCTDQYVPNLRWIVWKRKWLWEPSWSYYTNNWGIVPTQICKRLGSQILCIMMIEDHEKIWYLISFPLLKEVFKSTPEEGDQYISAEVILPRGDKMARSHVALAQRLSMSMNVTSTCFTFSQEEWYDCHLHKKLTGKVLRINP